MAWPQLGSAGSLAESVERSSYGHWWQSADQDNYVPWLRHLMILRVIWPGQGWKQEDIAVLLLLSKLVSRAPNYVCKGMNWLL